ncbi:L-aspartate oxidase [Virgibacillus siamensis]|uniref:L-aspartate oxidase n=1 Tax=Virgibacillus siamensis TaxID=480071 RepID=UPI000984133F|nr:L-aspartate oxidase [Virgibacillus siamensis]
MPDYDVIVIGCGIAALTIANRLVPDKNVAIITKEKRDNSNSVLAQGGIAAALTNEDTCDAHFTDTVVAGCRHNDADAVWKLAAEAPGRIRRLINQGMAFDRDNDGHLIFGKEGAHSCRRIIHVGGDATGKHLINHLLEQVSDRVTLIEDETAVDLITSGKHCTGVTTAAQHGDRKRYTASHVVLATGGCGGLYTYTSNAPSITGDGVAMAYRAGAELADMEFIQFHPTLLYHDGQGKGLISEAVRGEGAVLINNQGERIMKHVHLLKDLAPRDVVARTIFSRMLSGEQIFLDISMIEAFDQKFPTITGKLHSNGIDPEKGLIPVIPGAHFSMGGVRTDLVGQTSINGLFAAGETACTGAHGANRLASNSLLEGIVYGNRIAEKIKGCHGEDSCSLTADLKTALPVSLSLPEKTTIRQMMLEHVGITRSEAGLHKVIRWLETYKQQIDGCDLSELTTDQLTKVNMITAGWLIATSALMRTESRGAHFREDFPVADDLNWYQRPIIRKYETTEQLHTV